MRSSEGFAKGDLGFDTPYESSQSFYDDRHKKYSELYPEGYEMVWIGNWNSSKTIIDLLIKIKIKE